MYQPEEKYMRRALQLAEKGAGFVSPNPLVGAVIVKNGRVIGEGYHRRCGGPHAERNALASCSEDPRGAVLYVTLEPCCHWGKTPPCTEAVLQSGISAVVIGSRDPNPLVMGRGANILQAAGVDVIADFMKDQCDRINPVFFHYITSKTPFVTMKYAMTMDGKIATCAGHSRWITGEEARKRVHEDRHRFSAIMVGVGTVAADDPLLTCRIENGKNPIRIICDTRLSTPLHARVVATAKEIPTIVATSCGEEKKQKPFIERGCRILQVEQGDDGHLDLSDLMNKLGKERVDSVLLEGGSRLNWSALKAGVVQRVQAYVAPKLFGGESAKSPVGGKGAEFPDQAVMLRNPQITVIDQDILIESEVQKCSPE